MKKTLITLLALGCTAMAGQVENEVTYLLTGGQEVTLENSYDLSQDWKMTIEYAARGQSNLGSSTLKILTGELSSNIGVFTLTASKGGTTLLIGDSIRKSYSPAVKGTEAAPNITLTITFEDGVLTFIDDRFTTEDLTFDGVVLDGFKSAVTDAHVNSGWTCPKVTFTGATIGAPSVVPEPATATLSLLALAGLAARRRRH